MKIVIVENPRPLTIEHYNDVANAPLSASLNSGYALAVARQAGWDTAYLDFTSEDGDAASIATRILAEGGDLVLFHWVYAWGYEQEVCAILDLLQQHSPALLGAFGLFPSLARQRLLQFAPHLDFILAGEFEATLAELLQVCGEQGALATLPGVVVREEAFVARPLISDLARLPLPDDVGANCSYSSLNIAASRGCYGACSFCFIQRFYGCSRRRVRPLVSLEQELERRLARRSIDSLYFIDPSFIGPGLKEQERVLAIGRLAQGLGLPFGFETRVDTIEPQLVSRLAANGARSVFLGIESGCEAVLQRIGKRITTEQIGRAVRTVRDSGLQLTIGFIMFEPDTSLPELEENYRFLDGLGLLADHDLTANLLYHNQIVLYGSAAWERFEREGRLLLDPRLPFEARYRFRDERVGTVCSAMGRLAAAYFSSRDRIRLGPSGHERPGCAAGPLSGNTSGDINLLLKEAFRAFCSAAKGMQSHQVVGLEEQYQQQLRCIFPD
ncbi:MAG: radical SAM protein [Geobacteraceae bacterium]|nr:radical SAM protein [Geobacteraceae bacterium]